MDTATVATYHQTEYFVHCDISWIMNCTQERSHHAQERPRRSVQGTKSSSWRLEEPALPQGQLFKQPLIFASTDRRCYRSGTTQACGIKQLAPQIIDLKHLELPARNRDTHNSQGSTAGLTWRGKCFHNLAASQELLDCPGHTAG